MSRKDSSDGHAKERDPPKSAQELIRYGVGQTPIAAFLLALSDKGASRSSSEITLTRKSSPFDIEIDCIAALSP